MKCTALIVLLMACPLLGAAQVPHQISYQGFIQSGGQPVNATLPITVSLYAQSSGGSSVWSQAFPSVTVTAGVYTLLLDVPGIDFTAPYWLETTINGSVSATRTALASVPYSLGPWASSTGPASTPDKNELHTIAAAGSGQNIFYNDGNVGIGTANPTSLLEIDGQNALKMVGYQPFMTFSDANAGNANTAIQNANGDFAIFTKNDLGSGLPVLKLKSSSGSRMELLAQDGLNTIGFQPFMTLSDANAGYARTVLQNANGDLAIFTNNDLGTGLPVLKLKSSSGSRAELLGQDGFNTIGFQPFMTLTDANAGYARARMQCANGDLNLFAESALSGGSAYVVLKNGTGNVGIGTASPAARLDVAGHTRTQVLEITGGSDFAEPFETESGKDAEPGTVMIIDAAHPGKLVPSIRAYDTRVAGIVSGAGGIHPGVTLEQHGVVEGNSLIAIAGRVYCKAEALSAPIEPGDLLTSSGIEGYAMKAVDGAQSRGAVIGKAMTGLKGGKALVLVLVNLQ